MSITSPESLEAEFSPQQSRALVRVLEAESAAYHEHLATKADLTELRSEMRQGFANARFETQISERKVSEEVQKGWKSLVDRIDQAKSEGFRFALLATIGQMATLVGIMFYWFGGR